MSPVYAVIPSAVVLGPLAVLATVFPGVAAVLSVILKRWRAFLTVVGVHSTLAAIAFWWPGWEYTVRILIPLTALVGLIWAGMRYRRNAARDPAAARPPSRRSLHGLIASTLLLSTVMICTAGWFGTESLASLVGSPLVALTAGVFTAACYAGYRTFFRPDGSLSLSEEFVALLVMFVVSLALFPRSDRFRPVLPANPVEQSESADGPRLASARVLFRTGEMDEVMSAPVANGKRVYFGTARLTAFGSFGAVYAVDAESGAVAWRFDHGGKLRPVYATPAVAEGFVYCGEGLHSDADCQLYALKEATGDLAWALPTRSHTEGTPTVTGGRVFFSAGDDGLFCTEAGKTIWHRDGVKHRLHVDSPPAVADGRVYAGSGYRTWAVFALDAKMGEEVWRVPQSLRSFGPPLVLSSRVAFGLGTGNLTDDLTREPEVGEPVEREPAGAVLCVDGMTGKEAWRTPLPKSVHTQMAADAYRVYAACRDGCVYALDRQSGAVRWRRPVGTALVAGPVAVTAFAGGASLAIYTVTEEGLAVCLDPRTGTVVWTKDLSQLADGPVRVLSSPAVISVDPLGLRRAVFIGGSVTDRGTGRAAAVVFRLEDAIPAD